MSAKIPSRVTTERLAASANEPWSASANATHELAITATWGVRKRACTRRNDPGSSPRSPIANRMRGVIIAKPVSQP